MTEQPTPEQVREDALRSEIAVLRDLLETAYREADKARVESDKADDEALHWKAECLRLRAKGAREDYTLVKAFQARAERAEAALRAHEGEK